MGVGVIININIGGRLDGLYLFIKALEVRAEFEEFFVESG